MKIFATKTNYTKTTFAFLAVLFCLMTKSEVGVGQTTQTFTYNAAQPTQTFTVPAGTYAIYVECWGAGGGGSTITASSRRGGGGGGGAYAADIIYVTPGNSYSVVVGKGGVANTAGGNSTFNAASVKAAGGDPGGSNATTGGNGGTIANSIGTIEYQGGDAADGGGTNSGGGGGGAGSTGPGGSTTTGTAGTGTTLNGGNGGAGVSGSANGSAGSNYGGGGSGASTSNNGTDRTGGSGANGLVKVTYAIPYVVQFTALNTGATTWCAGETRNITVTVKNVGTATWTSGGAGVNFSYWWSNQGQDFNPRMLPFAGLAPNQSQVITVPVTATSAGAYTLNFDLVREGSCWFRNNTSGCSGPGNVLYTSPNITINAVPTSVTVSGGGTFCGNTTINATGGTGGTIYYQGTTSGGTSTATPSTSQNITSSGTYYFRANNGGCWGSEGSVTVTINPLPATTTVTPSPATFCTSGTINASNGSDGTMYFEGTTSNGTSIATPSASQTISTSGTYYFRAQSAQGCWGNQGSSVVTVNSVPTATTVSVSGSAPYCGSATINATGGTGGTIYYQGTTSGGTSTATASSSQTVSSSGTYYFRSNNGGCWGAEGSVTVTISAVPTATTVSVSGSAPYCGSATINATGGTGGTIYYQGTTSGGTSTATASTSQTVSASGTYYFRSLSAAGCWGAQGSVAVTITTPPAATTVSVSGSAPYCGSATINATGGTGGTIYYQGTTSGGTSTATASSSQTVSSSGTYYFRANNGGCWGPEGSATVTISPVPTATTVSVSGSAPYCGSATINATGGTGGTIYYQGTTSGGTSTATASTSQTVSASGTYYFRSLSAAGCWGAQGSVAVTITTPPAATTVSVSGSAPYCGSATINATGGTGGTIYYQGTTSGGTSTATASSSQTVSSSGTYYFRSNNGGCWGAEGSVTVTISAVPTATTVSVSGSAPYCGSATINATGGTGGTIYYQGTTSGGTSTATASTSQTVSASGTYYFRSLSAAGCWGAQGSVAVTITTPPAATTVSVSGSAPYCGSATINATGGTGGTIYYQGTTSGGTSTATASSSQTVSSSGTYYFRANNGGCWGPEGSATVTISPVPTATTVSVSGSAPYCGSATINATGGTGGTIYYQGTTSGGTSTATASTSQTVSASGTYYFRSLSAAGCWGAQGSVAVTITPLPTIASVTATPTTICNGSSSNLVVNAPIQSATTIVNYDFNSGSSYATLTPILASGISSTASNSSNTWSTTAGTATGTQAFTTNATTPGTAVSAARNNSWTFAITGSSLSNYNTFKVYFQAQRSSSATQTITISYSVNGGAFTTINVSPSTMTPGNGSFVQQVITLPSDADNPTSSLAINIAASGGNSGNTTQLDNFEVQAIPSDTYSWIAFPSGATAGLPANAGTALATNNNINVSPTVTTIYTVTATSLAGCQKTGSPVTVTVNPLPTITNAATATPKCFTSTAQTSSLTYSGTTNSPTTYSIDYDAAANTAGFVDITDASLPASAITIQIAANTAPGTYTGTLTVKNANGCTSIGTNFTVVINALPDAPTITPTNATVCLGSIQPLFSGVTNTVDAPFNSTSSMTILDNSSGSVPNTIAVSGIPAGATINSISVQFNITEGFDRDLLINLKAPNNNILNLFNGKGNSSDNNFTNTIVSSTGATVFASGGAPFTGTYAPDAVVPVTASTGYLSNVNSFNSLYTTSTSLNGNWIFSVRDNNIEGNNGTLSNWTITINYTTAVSPVPVTWSSATDLYTDATASTAYTGQSLATVYLKPSTTGSKTYTATATNAATGCASSTDIPVVVNALPSGTLTASQTTFCAGTSVTFTATSGYGAYTFKVNGTIVQASTSNTYSTNTLVNGDQVTVDVANSSNCGTTFNSITVAVNPLPTITFNADKTTICAGDNVTFTATGGTSYNFKINGTSITTNTTGIFSTTILNNGDVVTVDVTDGNSCTATSAAINMVVNPLPNGTLTATTSISVCPGTTVSFKATGGAQYQFRINGGIVQPFSNVDTYGSNSFSNGDVVTVDVKSSFGCTTTYSPGIPVTIYPLPTGTITTTETSGTDNDYKICTGANVKFTATAGFSHYTFYLRNTATILLDGTSNVLNTTTMTTGDYVTVVVTNGNSCTSTFPVSATIIVVPAPTGTLSVSPSNTICAGDNVTFTADPGFDNYNFQINGTTVQNGPTNTFSTTTLVGGDNVTVDVKNGNACVSTFNAIIMVVNPLPTGTLQISENAGAPNDAIICTGTPVTFTAPSGFSNYNFLLNGVSVQNTPTPTYGPITSLNNGDKVTVAVTGMGGCINLLNEYTLTVNPLPVVAPITASSFAVCAGSAVTFSDATNTPPGVWNSENSGIATVNASTGLVTGITAGTATIDYTYTNSNGCSTTVTATVTVNALPDVEPITGNFNICTGFTSQLSDATNTGGTWVWSSDNTGVASVDAATGLVTGAAPGNATISYAFTDGNGCTTVVTEDIVVADAPSVASIITTAPSGFNVCIGGTIKLKDATPGGTWSSINGTVATINSTGTVTGLIAGTTEIRYTITTTCGQTVYASQTVTVHAPPTVTISYAGTPFCTTAGVTSVTKNGSDGDGSPGTYFASPSSGLSIDPSTGDITPSTSTPGTYTVTYKILASGGCGDYITTTQVTITANPTITSFSYSGTPYCSTVTSASPSLTASTTTGNYTYTVVSGGPTLTLNSSTGVINPSTSSPGTYSVTFQILASGGCSIVSKTTSVTITANPTITSFSYSGTPYCSTVTSASPSLTASTTTGNYTYTVVSGGPTLTLNSSTGIINPSTSSAGTYSITFQIAAANGCSIVNKSTSVIITPAPAAVAGNPVSVCSNASGVSITSGASATNYSSILWSSSGSAGTITNPTSLTTATYTPSAADIAAGSVTLTLKANGNGGCATAATSTKTLTITNPTPITNIAASPSTMCLGSSSNLTASVVSTLVSESFDGTSSFTLTNPATSDRPAQSQWTKRPGTYTYNGSVTVTFGNATPFMLTVSDDPLHTTNRINTIITSPVVSTVGYTSLIFSYNTYYRHKASDVDVVVEASINGTTWTTVQDLNAAGTTGAPNSFANKSIDLSSYINKPNFQIRFRYNSNNGYYWAVDDAILTGTNASGNYSWTAAPAAGAGLPAGAGTPSTANASIIVTPTVANTYTYTATLTNGSGCTSTKNVSLIVNPTPVVSITADYCISPGKVRLTATSTPAATSYTWSTGQTGSTIDVDIAGDYQAYATLGSCTGTGTISVAQELVTNGDFSAGGSSPQTTAGFGFTSDYTFHADVPGLVPAGQGELYDDSGTNGYSITDDANNVHTYFFGQDHTANTTGARNFMVVNGHSNTLVVWKQTVNVLPNTTYYFSAWAMSLNDAGPFAQLRFSVNGTLVGNTAVLASGPNSTTSSAINGWTRFYGTWTSGPTTTSADIYINDLQPSLPGNDFGLDDVSFATLSTFITLESAPGTDAQTICVNTPLTPIVYNVGNGSASGPTVSGLPSGVTSVFAGDKLTISGTPTSAAGSPYTYTITTTGCNPYSVTGTITVQSQKIALSSGSSSPSVCVNSPVNIGFTLSGTATNATITGAASAFLTGAISGSGPTYTYTVSGTPTATGTYPYTITTSGTCDPVTFSGTITVTAQTITLNAGDNNNQTVCINLPITNIRYTVGGTATSATVTGLPSGVTGTFSGGIFTIKGSPTDATGSPYTYTVTTTPATGSCDPVSITGTIAVTPGATLTLTSDPSTNPQTVCKGAPIIPITYTINNATMASATGLPAGVTGSVSGTGPYTYTISGTPTGAVTTFNYTINTTDGCTIGTATGTIIVQAQTISLKSGSLNPSVCAGVTMPTNIVFTIGGTATGASVTGLPAGLNGAYDIATGLFTISGTPLSTDAAGPYSYTVTTLPATGACNPVTATGTITISPSAIGGNLASSTASCSGDGTLTLQNQVGTIIRWESSTDNFNTIITPIANTSISLSYTNIIAPTQFRVVVGNNCGNVYSQVATVGVQNYWVGITSDDWNTASNWSSNQVASLACPVVTIPAGTPHDPIIYPGTNAVANSLTINSGASLTMNGTGNLTLSSGATFTNNGTFTANTGSGIIKFNGAGTINGSNVGTFNNLTMNGALTLTKAPVINGNFTINSGVVSGSAPTYGSSSTLTYNISGAYTTSIEWNAGNAATLRPGVGIPQDVNISNGIVSIASAGGTADRSLGGNLSIGTNATFNLSPTTNHNLYVAGNWTNNGTFVHNSRGVTFDGSSNQTITGNSTFFDLTENQTGGANLIFAALHTTVDHNLTIAAGTMTPNINTLIEFTGTGNLAGGNTKTFYDLQIDNTSAMTITSGGVGINHNFVNNGTYTYSGVSRLTTFAGSGISQSMSGAAGSSTIFGTVVIGDNHPLSLAITLSASNDYTIQGGSLSLSHSSTLNNTGNTVTFSMAAATVTGPGIANFNNATANVAVNFGSSISTINGNLKLNNGGSVNTNVPNYGPASTLTYNTTTATLNPALEWNVNSATTGLGEPQNVSVTNTNSVVLLADRTVPGTLNLSAGSLGINGNTFTVNNGFTGTGGNLRGSVTSNLIAGGTGTINFDPSANTLKNFTINNLANLDLGKALIITPGDFSVNNFGIVTANGILNANDHLTLRSGRYGEGIIGQSSGTINGNVTVERFIPEGRAWRFLTVPVNSNQTINQAWQDSVVNPDVFTQLNPHPGFSTDITYDNNPANGYDVNTTYNPSIQYWNATANNFVPLPLGTKSTNINAYPGYYLFIRGSRAVNLSQGIYAIQDATVLRATGTLNQINGNNVVKNLGSLSTNQYYLIGNPYASPIDLTNILDGSNRTTTSFGFKPEMFWVWDPKLAGSFGVGAYVEFSNGIWAPAGGSYQQNDPPVIQSGQAFMVQADGTKPNVSLDFREVDKNASEKNVFGFVRKPQNPQAVFYTNLLAPSGNSLTLMDGVAAAFGEGNSAGIDEKNASKKWNKQESIGLYRDSNWNAIEFRPIPVLTDTLFYSIYYTQQKNYTLQITAENIPAGFPQAWLVDKYLNTKTAVNVDTVFSYNFTANSDINSYRNRFMLVFRRTFIATPVPVTKVINQADPGTTGNAKSIAGTVASISVHPNPIATGEKVLLQFNNMSKGKYQVTVTNTVGKALTEKTIMHDGGSNIYSLQTDARWAAGSYFVKITGENGYSLVTKLVISK